MLALVSVLAASSYMAPLAPRSAVRLAEPTMQLNKKVCTDPLSQAHTLSAFALSHTAASSVPRVPLRLEAKVRRSLFVGCRLARRRSLASTRTVCSRAVRSACRCVPSTSATREHALTYPTMARTTNREAVAGTRTALPRCTPARSDATSRSRYPLLCAEAAGAAPGARRGAARPHLACRRRPPFPGPGRQGLL
jgi:hypothetical protein